MELVLELLNKLLVLLFYMSTLNVLRTTYFFIQSYVTNNRYSLSPRQLWLLSISVGYVLTTITTGLFT